MKTDTSIYLNVDAFNFMHECGREFKAGVLQKMKLKVLFQTLESDLNNQKLLRRRFWEAWDYQERIVKLKQLDMEVVE